MAELTIIPDEKVNDRPWTKGTRLLELIPPKNRDLIAQIRGTNLEPGAKEKGATIKIRPDPGRTAPTEEYVDQKATPDDLRFGKRTKKYQAKRPRTGRKRANLRNQTTVEQKHPVIKTHARHASQVRAERKLNGKGMDAVRPPGRRW